MEESEKMILNSFLQLVSQTNMIFYKWQSIFARDQTRPDQTRRSFSHTPFQPSNTIISLIPFFVFLLAA